MQLHAVVVFFFTGNIVVCDRARCTIASALSSMIPNDLNYDRILNGLRRVVICLRITWAHVDRHSRKGTTQAHTQTSTYLQIQKQMLIQTHDSHRRQQRKQQNEIQIEKWQNRLINWSTAHRTHNNTHTHARAPLSNRKRRWERNSKTNVWNVHFVSQNTLEGESSVYFGACGSFDKYTVTRRWCLDAHDACFLFYLEGCSLTNF